MDRQLGKRPTILIAPTLRVARGAERIKDVRSMMQFKVIHSDEQIYTIWRPDSSRERDIVRFLSQATVVRP